MFPTAERLMEINFQNFMKWMEIFEAKKAEVQALKTEIGRTDNEIDQMVYGLYGLSEEEIGIVEGAER